MDPQDGMPGAGPALGADAPAAAPDLGDSMSQQLAGSSAMFAKMQQGKKMLGTARKSLDHLVSLGDNVTVDDITEMGGALVGAGLSPSAVAGLLGSMPPEGGTALAGWVQQQDQGLQQREAAMEQAHGAMQHHLGVNAMRMLAGHHLGQPQEAPQSPALGLPPSAPMQ